MMAHDFAKTAERLYLIIIGETGSFNMKDHLAEIQLNERQFMKDICISVHVVVKCCKRSLRYALLVGMRFGMQNHQPLSENWC